MDQLTKLVLVKSERIGGIESPDAQAAERATPFFVERELVAERRPALDAEIIGR
jgi:hypothetical protein